MKTLAVVAHKGGAGKSTLAIHLATLAFRQGLRVGIIDLDPQKTALKWNNRRAEEDRLAVIACDADELQGYLDQARANALDFVVVDTPPHANASAVTAAQLADFTLVPTGTSVVQLETVAETVYLLKQTRCRFAVVLNAVRRGVRLVEETRAVLTQHDVNLLPEVVHSWVSLDYALNDGSSVHEFDPVSGAAQEIEALYNSITSLMSDTVTSPKPKKPKKVAA